MAHMQVKVSPGARETVIVGWQDGVLRLKVREVAEKGRANEAVARLIAKRLEVPVSAISVKRGATARTKLLEVMGLTDEDVSRRLGRPML